MGKIMGWLVDFWIARDERIEKERRKLAIALDTIDRVSKEAYRSRPFITSIRGTLEAGRIKLRMVDEPKGIFELERPVLVGKSQAVPQPGNLLGAYDQTGGGVR